jgi:hypothetical protein
LIGIMGKDNGRNFRRVARNKQQKTPRRKYRLGAKALLLLELLWPKKITGH